MGLIEEFKLTLEQINWRRYALETKCSGDEATMRREYPARPEEAFEAAEGSVLDMAVLARWMKEAEAFVPSRGSMVVETHAAKEATARFDPTDKYGKIEVYEPPRYGHRYVLGLDASNGVAGGDYTVGCVLDVDSGVQVAEYRACVDPDLAVDQVEGLALWYNKALCAVERSGGYGMPFLRHLLDRQTVPVYEREVYDKMTRQLAKSPGWDTNVKTRPLLVAAMREAVRKEKIKLKSITTISECRTLHEKKTGEMGLGKIEARPGCKDDGFFGAGIAQMVRNGILRVSTSKEEEKRKERPFLKRLSRLAKLRDRALTSSPFPVTHVRPASPTGPDRSRL